MSLHDGLAWLWRGGRIEVGDGESTQHGGGALRAACDGAFGGAIAEIDVDHAHGLEGGQGFGGGEIEACGLELLFDGTVKQEGQCGDEDVGLHAIIGAMIDRPHVEDVLEIGEGALDFRQFLVEPHGIDRGQIGLFGLDDVFAFVRLLAGEVDGMLEEAKDAVLVGPAVIAMAMIAGEDVGRGGADLLGCLEPALGDALIQLFELWFARDPWP